MRYPKFLSENGTIGIVSPSFGVDGFPYLDRYNKAIEQLQNHGFKIQEANNVHEFIHEEKRAAEELQRMYLDDHSDFLMTTAGGEFQFLTQEYLNHEVLSQAKPKWFMGYSDNTNFCFPLTTICDVASVYGINITDLGANVWDDSHLNNIEFMQGKKLKFNSYPRYQWVDMKKVAPLDGYNYDSDGHWVNLCGGNDIKMQGRLIGGCLECLYDICGSPFDKVAEFSEKYQEDGIIFMFEVYGYPAHQLKCILKKLELCGWFKHLNGVIVGRPNSDVEIFGYTYDSVVEDFFKGYNIPVVAHFDTGHVPPSIPMILGSITTVISNDEEQSVEFELK